MEENKQKEISEVQKNLEIYKSKSKELVSMLKNLKPSAQKNRILSDCPVNVTLRDKVIGIAFENSEQAKKYFDSL